MKGEIPAWSFRPPVFHLHNEKECIMLWRDTRVAPEKTDILTVLCHAAISGGRLQEVVMYRPEIWKPIPGFKHYEASSLGRVRIIAHKEKARNRWGEMERQRNGKILNQAYRGEYLACSVKNRPRSVHRLVAKAFHGLPPEGHIVNHKNGIKEDNRPENLEWVTYTENVHHALYVLGKKEGPRKPMAMRSARSITDYDRANNLPPIPWNKGIAYPNVKGKATRKRNYLARCKALLEEYNSGDSTQTQLADKYGVSRRTISEQLRAAREEAKNA